MNLKKFYNAAWHYMKRSERDTLDLDDRVYMNLLDAVYKKVKDNELFCYDIMCSCVDRFLAEDYKCDNLNEGRVEELLKNIIDTFELNKKTHYLLIPFNGGRLEKDIYFGNYSFIIGNEDKKIHKIADLTGYDQFELKTFIEHTKRSRSKHFMEHPLLVLKIENVNSNVYYNSAYLAKLSFMVLKLMIYSTETENTLFNLVANHYEDNYHVAIIGDENWQYGHGNWHNLINFKYSLDFMESKENQRLFLKLMDSFAFSNDKNDLYHKFLNALELFEKSLEQEENYKETTLSYMLLFAAAESLLTEGKNEKKLRLSVIWPRLVSISKSECTSKELGALIREKYDLRNEFVHAGSVIKPDEGCDLRILHQMLAKLIMKYIDDSWVDNNKGLESWENYIKSTFEDAVYS